MKKLILPSLIGGLMLLISSCSKTEHALPASVRAIAKQTKGFPAGFMTDVLPSGTYKFISCVSTIDPATNKSIGVAGDHTSAGDLIEQRDFANTVQEWRITQTGYGTYSIINYNSGLALDDKNYSQADNNPIWQQPFNSNTSQEWVIAYQGYGVYRIESLVNLNMGLHVAGGSTANGANIVLKTFATDATQAWGYFFVYPMPISNPPVTVHTPDAQHTDKYPRVITLPNGNLLAAIECDTIAPSNSIQNNHIKICRSTNGGSSWTSLPDLTDTHRHGGLWDPELYVTPIALGSLPAHTLLCALRSQLWAGASFMDIYKSTDNGSSWTYVSNIAAGISPGRNLYEPFLLVDSYGRLICYYSDERDPAHSQKLVYQVSTDGAATWGATVTDVVALPTQGDRPGMFRATKMGNGTWMGTYEYAGSPDGAVHYKTSTDGVNWGSPSSPGNGVASIDGVIPAYTPSILWTPAGTTSGTVIVTSGQQHNPSSSYINTNFVNFTYGTGNWYTVPQPLPYNPANAHAGYSRNVNMSADGKTLYHINCVDISTTQAKVVFVATPAW